jgi:hypothetical protein
MSLFPFYFLYHIFPTSLLKEHTRTIMALPHVQLIQTFTPKTLDLPNVASSLPSCVPYRKKEAATKRACSTQKPVLESAWASLVELPKKDVPAYHGERSPFRTCKEWKTV